jgi:hypothetical protein
MTDDDLNDATRVLHCLFEQRESPSGAQFRQLVTTMLQSPELVAHMMSQRPNY